MSSDSNIVYLRAGRQLFIDDFLISHHDLGRIYPNPIPCLTNPVLEPTEVWEKTAQGALYAGPFSDGVWYDERDEIFKMWYMAGAGQYYPDIENALYTCYAESKDGITWNKKPQDIVKGTNVVDITLRDAASIWLDKFEKDLEKRFKLFIINRRNGGKDSRLILKFSADGIHWSVPKATSGKVRDRISAFYNPLTKKWVVSMRYETPALGKARSYASDASPEKLVKKIGEKDKGVFWFGVDGSEPRHPKFPEIQPGIYNFDVIPYESILLGYFTIWQGPSNEKAGELNIHKRNEVFLGFSRDGINFTKISGNPFFKVNESDGAWNWGNVQSTHGSPIIMGDNLYFYYTGRRLNDIMWDSHMSVGMAKLRRDGFVALKGDESGGVVCTKKVYFKGFFLFVNANVSKGILQAEILDEEWKIIPGYSKEECLKMKHDDQTKYKIEWLEKKDLRNLQNKVVRIRFYLKSGEFYSFWVSPFSTGESLGYTAGGGPHLDPSGIDSPVLLL